MWGDWAAIQLSMKSLAGVAAEANRRKCHIHHQKSIRGISGPEKDLMSPKTIKNYVLRSQGNFDDFMLSPIFLIHTNTFIVDTRSSRVRCF